MNLATETGWGHVVEQTPGRGIVMVTVHHEYQTEEERNQQPFVSYERQAYLPGHPIACFECDEPLGVAVNTEGTDA